MALPRHVRAYKRSGAVAGYRAVVSTGEGRRWYGPIRQDPAEAGGDASRYLASSGKFASGVTIARALDLLVLELDRRGTSEATEQFYRAHSLPLVDYFGADTPLAAITPGQVYEFADRRRLAGVSVATVWTKDITTLRRLIGVSVRRGLLTADPIAGLERPQVRQGRYAVFTAERIADACRRIRESSNPSAERDALAIEMLFGTGLRRAELGRVRRCDVDLDGRTMHVQGKVGDRTIPLEGIGLRAATGLCEGKVGTDRIGPHPEALTSLCWRWKERLGIPGFSPHALRHSFATDAVRRGVSPFVLATLMGHASPKQTFRYYRSDGHDVREAMRSIGGHDASDHG